MRPHPACGHLLPQAGEGKNGRAPSALRHYVVGTLRFAHPTNSAVTLPLRTWLDYGVDRHRCLLVQLHDKPITAWEWCRQSAR